MNLTHCPACESDALVSSRERKLLTFKGIEVDVPDVASTICERCGYRFVTNDQHDSNVAAARAAYTEQRAFAKAERGLLTGAELRAMREELNLNQKEASELFGGGPVAFSKYENEDVAQSVAMDRLVRLVHDMGAFGVKSLRAAMGQRSSEVTAPNASTRGEVVNVKLVPIKEYRVAKELPQLHTQSGSHQLTPSRRVH